MGVCGKGPDAISTIVVQTRLWTGEGQWSGPLDGHSNASGSGGSNCGYRCLCGRTPALLGPRARRRVKGETCCQGAAI